MIRRLAITALFLYLVGCYILCKISTKLEPYPAVLLPEGASLVDVGDTVLTHEVIEAFAVLPDSSVVRIPPKDLLGRIPISNFIGLAKRDFGLKPPRFSSRWRNLLGGNREWTEEERQQTLRWFAERAKACGHPTAVAIRLERVKCTFSTRTHHENAREILQVHDIPLVHA